MSRERKSHQPKTIFERIEYHKTIINEQSSAQDPTLEDTVRTTESTDTSLSPDYEQLAQSHPTRESWYSKLPTKQETLKIILSGLIITLIGWICYEVYVHNRQIGELQTNITNQNKDISDVKREIEKAEERLSKQIDKISSGVKNVENRVNSYIDSSQHK